jgi:hypothetical protein
MVVFRPWQELDYQLLFGNPIPPYLSINLAQKKVLSLYVNSPTAKPNWKFAGWLKRTTTIVGVPTTEGQVAVGETIPLWLRKTQLIEFNEDFGIYQILIEFPHWLDTVELALWQSEKIV